MAKLLLQGLWMHQYEENTISVSIYYGAMSNITDHLDNKITSASYDWQVYRDHLLKNIEKFNWYLGQNTDEYTFSGVDVLQGGSPYLLLKRTDGMKFDSDEQTKISKLIKGMIDGINLKPDLYDNDKKIQSKNLEDKKLKKNTNAFFQEKGNEGNKTTNTGRQRIHRKH